MSGNQINLNQLLDTFQFFDTDKNGTISMNEFQAACQKLQMPIDRMNLSGLFQDRDGISFDEFCRIVQDNCSHVHNNYFHETFRAFDKNSDGYITAKEIKKTMKELGEPLTTKQAKEMIKIADISQNGKLSEEEFRKLYDHLTQFKDSPSTPTFHSQTTDDPDKNEYDRLRQQQL